MSKIRAFRVYMPEYIVFADDKGEATDPAIELAAEGYLLIEPMTIAELRFYGDQVPASQYDPERELTCAEIADEMVRSGIEEGK